MISESQKKFLDKRRLLIKYWPWAGYTMLIIVIGFWSYLFFKQPLLVNPYHVVMRINDGSLSSSLLALLGVIGSAGFLTCGLLLFIFILFLFSIMSIERKLIYIIDELLEPQDDEDTGDL